MHKKIVSTFLIGLMILAIPSGCIAIKFETHIGTENNVDIKFETPIGSEERTAVIPSAIATRTSATALTATVAVTQEGGLPTPTRRASTTPVVGDGILKFSDEFEGVSYGWAKWGKVAIKGGSVEISQSPSGGSGMTLQNGISEGMGIVFLFKYTKREFNIYLANKASYWDTYVGINTAPHDSSLHTAVAVHEKFIGGQSLDGNLSLSPDHWYFVMIKILNGGSFYIRVWDKDNPNNYRETGVRLGNEWEGQDWYPAITIMTGQVTIDFYQELEFYKPTNPTRTPSPTEDLSWAVSFEHHFPLGFWSVGAHGYTFESNCPNIENGSGSITKTFEVSQDASLLPSDVYLRISGLRDGPFESSAVDRINPKQSTTAIWSLIEMTQSEAQLAVTDCNVTISWDGGAPQILTPGTPFERN